MTGTPDTGNRSGPTAIVPDRPTLEPNERLWLEGYLERLRKAPGELLKRLVVYGSKARGDAGPDSDVDVLVLVGDVPEAVEEARRLIYAGDDPGDVDHEVVVRTEADWLRGIEMELPFPRNVEAEGVQIHPEYRAAKMRPGDRPPVTREGIRHAVPVWLKRGRNELRLADKMNETEAERLNHPGIVARPAFDAVFFSAMAWCLTRGVSVVRRKDLPTSVERHLIEPGVLNADWQDRIRTLWTAWEAEVEWRPGQVGRADGRRRRGMDGDGPGVLRARPGRDRGRGHRHRPSRRARVGRERGRGGRGAVSGGGRRKPRTSARGWVEGSQSARHPPGRRYRSLSTICCPDSEGQRSSRPCPAPAGRRAARATPARAAAQLLGTSNAQVGDGGQPTPATPGA